MTDPTPTPAAPIEETPDDALATLPADKLAAMLRDKRKAEAALRGRLRDVEAERDRLAETVTGQQWRDVETAATARGLRPEAMADLKDHLEITEVLTDGAVDDGKLGHVLDQVRTDRPHYFEATPSASSVDHAGGAGEAVPAYQASWADVLNP